MQTDRSIARSLTLRYAIALALVATLTTAAWVSLYLVISEQKSTAAIVNISGRQRMLSQRIALFSSLLVNGAGNQRTAVRARLQDAVNLMQKSHQGLTHGDADMGLPATMSPAVSAMYSSPPLALDRQVETYIDHAQRLLQVEDKNLRADDPALQYILDNAQSRLLTSLDEMVRQYQREGESAISRLHKAETIVWLVTLLLLALEAMLIFHPFVRHIRSIIGQLEVTTETLLEAQELLEERVRQRTADLEQKSKALAESEEKFRLISTSAKDAILIIDEHESITYWNPAATALFGYSAEQALGQNMHNLLAPPRYRDDIRRGFDNFRRTGSGPVLGRIVEMTAIRHDGEEFPIELSISPLHMDGRLYALGIIRDHSERKRMENELRQLATTDPLTGLANRRQFLTAMQEQLALIHRRMVADAAVLMVDIDYFKRVNDTYGHGTGDDVLRHVANLMSDGLRQIDTVGRLGGEEFSILLPGTDLESARYSAERLRHIVESTPAIHNGNPLPVTISIGIAPMSALDTETDPVLARADRALYRAKDGGRNRVEAESRND